MGSGTNKGRKIIDNSREDDQTQVFRKPAAPSSRRSSFDAAEEATGRPQRRGGQEETTTLAAAATAPARPRGLEAGRGASAPGCGWGRGGGRCGHVGELWARVGGVPGLHALGVEAAHLHRRLRQRDVAAGVPRRVRAHPAPLPRRAGKLRRGPLQPQVRATGARLLRHRPQWHRQAGHLRGRRQRVPALPCLRRRGAQGDHPRRARPQPRAQRRLQG